MQAASMNGDVIVGIAADLLRGTSTAVRWTAQTGIQDLGIPDAKISRAFNVSADGSVVSGAIVDNDGKSQGFLLSKKKGFQKFGSGWHQVETSGISDDGNVVAGTFWHGDYDPQAFYWTEREGVQSLADDRYFQAMKLTDTAALGISRDGSTIVGWAADDNRDYAIAFRWTKSAGVKFIREVGGGNGPSLWMGVSSNGAVIVGNANDGTYRAGKSRAFRWTQEDGPKTLVPESSSSIALGMSSDGSKVFGTYEVSNRNHFFVWTKDGGVHDAGMEDGHYQYLITDQAIIRIEARD
ncbi:hypothetical protein B2G74_00110 [Burkholderia sp. A27]|nr:hypothetical protein B2G74_00110 [Burkholderia sp. A27]